MNVGDKVVLNDVGKRNGFMAAIYKNSIGVVVECPSGHYVDSTTCWVEWSAGGYDNTWKYYKDELSVVQE